MFTCVLVAVAGGNCQKLELASTIRFHLIVFWMSPTC